MVRGLFGKYKQPLYIDFDKNVTKNLLDQLIEKLHQTGYTVVCVVSDNGGSNVGLWNELDISVTSRNCQIKSYFEHPVTKSEIMFFSDAPHCLKLLRNWLIDGGFQLSNGTILSAKKITELLTMTNTELSPTFKLTLNHLNCSKTERQNVRLAAELLSHSTAVALRKNFPPEDKEAYALADFVELVNSWFDVMNSYSPNGKLYKKPYGLDLERQNQILDKMSEVILDIKCYNRKKQLQNSLQIFQKGILLSINSLKRLHKNMKENYNMTYLMTHRCNQDFLENFFCQVRRLDGQKDHPSPVNCCYRIRSIILGKHVAISKHLHTNTVDKDPDEFISTTLSKHLAISDSDQYEEGENMYQESSHLEDDLNVVDKDIDLFFGPTDDYSDEDFLQINSYSTTNAEMTTKQLQSQEDGIGKN